MKTKVRLQGNSVIVGTNDDAQIMKTKTRHEVFNTPIISKSDNEYGAGLKLRRIQARTTVTIVDNKDEIKSTGISECSISDQFNRNVGRRIAVGRAIKALN